MSTRSWRLAACPLSRACDYDICKHLKLGRGLLFPVLLVYALQSHLLPPPCLLSQLTTLSCLSINLPPGCGCEDNMLQEFEFVRSSDLAIHVELAGPCASIAAHDLNDPDGYALLDVS